MDIDMDTRGRQYKSFQEIVRDSHKIQDYMIKCKSSHTILFTWSKDRLLCSHCGNWVYKDKKTEIKYKMKEYLKWQI